MSDSNELPIIMRTLLTLFLTVYWLNASSQEVVNDWKELSEETTLNEYIENQAYSYLKFNPTKKDTTNNIAAQISRGSTDTNVIIRDKASINPPKEPLVVVNGYPIERRAILSEIRLTDIDQILLLKSTEQSGAIYGIRGTYGVILVEMNKRRWKNLKKNYDR